MDKFKLKLDPFITDTRLTVCFTDNCVKHDNREYNCGLKTIKMGKNGLCHNFVDRDKNKITNTEEEALRNFGLKVNK